MESVVEVKSPAPSASSRAEITVVMPAYQAQSFIGEAIQSALSQSYPDFILHIHDDGSTDNTLQGAIEATQKDDRVRITSGENRGSPSAFNLLVKASSTRLTALMGADDLIYGHRLEAQRSYMTKHPSAGIVAGGMDFIGPQAPTIGPPQIAMSPGESAAFLLHGNAINGGTVTARTDLLKKFRFNEELRVAQDYDLWCRLAAAGHELHVTDDIVYRYRLHGENTIFKKSADLARNSANSNRNYRRAMFGNSFEAKRLSAWLGWTFRESHRGIRDIQLMDSSLRIAFSDHGAALADSYLPRKEVEELIDSIIRDQYYRLPSISSAQSLYSVARNLGIRPALVGLRRGLSLAPRWALRSRATPIDWNTAPLKGA